MTQEDINKHLKETSDILLIRLMTEMIDVGKLVSKIRDRKNENL